MDHPAAFPWDLLGTGGAVAAVIAVVWLFLAELGQQRREFIAALEKVTDHFIERVSTIAKATEESNARVEMTVRDMAAEMRQKVER